MERVQREWKLRRVCFYGGSGLIEERVKKKEKTLLELSGTSLSKPLLGGDHSLGSS